MEEKDNSHKKWAGKKKPSMKRRSEEQDYTERGIYLITLAIEGRRPLLGTLAGNPDDKEGPNAPHVILSPLGDRVRNEWLGIPRYYPQIEVLRLCVMPDHIHGILFVHERIERHLGHVLNGFKTGTRRAARQLRTIAEAQPRPTEPNAAPSPPRPTEPNAAPPSPFPPVPPVPPVPYAEAVPQPKPPSPPPSPVPPVPYAEAVPQPSPKHPPVGTLWEPGYNDRLLLKKGQLQHWLAYLDDNPRRLLLKHRHPEYFTQLAPIPVLDRAMPAMGNRFLLDRPLKLQVQCSRHLYPAEIEQQKLQFLEAGRQGAVIVSPCISPGEQQIATACMAAGIPLIVLLLKGFPPFFKPQPRYLEACAAGRLLMLAPYPWQNEKLTDMRQRCLRLNDLAACICKG